MKKVFRMILIVVMMLTMMIQSFSPIQAMSNQIQLLQVQQDINTIKQRLKEHFLLLDAIDDGAKVETCRVSTATDYLKSMKADGSWADVDYAARDNAANGRPWSPYLALDRMQAMAIAYWLPGNELYQDQNVIKALNNAFIHWQEVNPSSVNWWENDIGVQLRFGRIGLFLENDLSTEAFAVITKKLNTEGKFQGTGQNNLWYDQNALYRALITNDAKQLKKVIDECLSYVLVLQTDNVTKEALQVDNSLYFHGEQFYSNGYGLSMFRDMSFWLFMFRDTSFAIDQSVVDRMSDYMLDGTRWTIRGDIAELYLGYRPYKYDVEYTNYAAEYIAPLERMKAVDIERSDEYQVLLDNILRNRKDNGLDGNHYMWRVGYASHMRENYGVNIKMDSKRIIGGEWRGSWSGEDNGNLIYWTSSATSTIVVDGDEYTSVFPTYDWAHSPGVTSPNRIPKDYSNYGRINNTTDHTMGVSNGTYGSTSYVMSKKDTQATKGYFFFDDEFVALGAGIKSTETSAIHTTLNQTKADTVVVDGQGVDSGTKGVKYTGNWIYNNKVGYVFPTKTNFYVSNTSQKDSPSLWGENFKEETPDTFSAWIDHGAKPSDETYEYIVLPDTSSTDVDTYANNIPITIVENSKEIQAVRHDGLKITQINFYKAQTLEYADGKFITVNQPCNVIIDETGTTPLISLAVADTDYEKSVDVDLTIDDVTSTTKFIASIAPYTGQTMTLLAGQDNMYMASSFNENHPPKLAYDGDNETYWKSETEEEQWILQALGKNTFIGRMNIKWKDNYATKYKVQISTDGYTYVDVAEVNNGTGGNDDISIYAIASHVKVVCLKSNAQQGYEIQEISYSGGENIALNKKVEASSTSTKDSANVPQLAVDGNSSSRWSSARASDAEWIMVDLGGQAIIDAIRISWESARSSKYIIEISDDAKTWMPLQTVEEENALLDEIVFEESVHGRYVRINSVKSKLKDYGISIFELEIYGQVELEPENIAIGKSVSASSINSTDAPSRAVDGNLGTFWKSDLEENHWLNVALRDVYTIFKVVVNWGNTYVDSYNIEISNDGENWTIIETIDNCLGGREVLNFNDSVDAKYIRVIGHTATKKNIVINEFEVFGKIKEEAEKVNLALNKPSKASSEYKNPKSNFILESKYAFDGSIEDRGDAFQSRWVSNRESNDEWIQVDLLEDYLIDSVILNWEGACGKEYKILVSKDEKNWQEIEHVTNGSPGIKEIILGVPVEGRYVKMQGIVPQTKYGYSLWEFEVYGQKEKLENIALNKDSKASSEYKNPKSNFILESKYAFDGSVEDRGDAFQSRWVSNRESNDEWIYVNLHGRYDIRSIILNWEGACGKEYKLQVSNDAYTWKDIAYVTDGKAGIREFIIGEPVYAQYVKMQGIVPQTKYGYSLWEFEVYGKKIADFYVDKTYLEEKITEHTGILGSGYTIDSYTAYKEALIVANNTLSNESATQEEVNRCIDNLETTVVGLEKRETETLETAIVLAKEKVEELYTKESYLAMNSVLQEAINMLELGANNPEYAQMAIKLHLAIEALIEKPKEPEVSAKDIVDKIIALHIVDDALEILQYEGFTIVLYSSSNEDIIALDGHVNRDNETRYVGIVLLVINNSKPEDTAFSDSINVEVTRKQVVIDYEGLTTMIALAMGKNKGDFTKNSYQEMTLVLQQAQALIKDGAMNNEEVENTRVALQQKLQNLVSLIDLKATITTANGLDAKQYTKYSFASVLSAIDFANIIMIKDDASKSEVLEATNALHVAISGLIKQGDATQLEELIKEIEALDISKYTKESNKEIQRILEQAKQLLATNNASPEQINDIYQSLLEAFKSLEEVKSKEPIPDSELEIVSKNNHGNQANGVNTGDVLASTSTLMYMLFSAIIWLIFKRKKQERT